MIQMPTEAVENARGGKQSATAYRMDLIPPLAVLAVAGVLKRGAEKYGEENWRDIPVRDHINHAMIHLTAYLKGDLQEDHLANAACRALFALELAQDAPDDTYSPVPTVEQIAKAWWAGWTLTGNVGDAWETVRGMWCKVRGFDTDRHKYSIAFARSIFLIAGSTDGGGDAGGFSAVRDYLAALDDPDGMPTAYALRAVWLDANNNKGGTIQESWQAVLDYWQKWTGIEPVATPADCIKVEGGRDRVGFESARSLLGEGK